MQYTDAQIKAIKEGASFRTLQYIEELESRLYGIQALLAHLPGIEGMLPPEELAKAPRYRPGRDCVFTYEGEAHQGKIISTNRSCGTFLYQVEERRDHGLGRVSRRTYHIPEQDIGEEFPPHPSDF